MDRDEKKIKVHKAREVTYTCKMQVDRGDIIMEVHNKNASRALAL